MALNIKLLYRSLPWCLALGLALVAFLSMRTGLAQYEQNWQERLARTVAVQGEHLHHSEREAIQQAQLLTQRIGRDPQVLQLLARAHLVQLASAQPPSTADQKRQENLRSELVRLLGPYWQELDTDVGNELNIYWVPNAINFLRMQTPQRFGDSLEDISNLITAALDSEFLLWGVEVGREGSGYRAVLPVTINELPSPEASSAATEKLKPIALIEVALKLAPSQAVEMATFIRKATLDKMLWTQVQEELYRQNPTAIEEWRLESASQSQLSEWWLAGKVPLGRQGQLVEHNHKTYLASWWTVPQYSPASATPENMPLGVLTWQDFSEPYAQYLASKQELIECWLAIFVAAELLLLALVRLDRYVFQNLMRQSSEEIRREHHESERARQRLALALRSSDAGFWEWDIANDKAKFSPEWRALCGVPPEAPESLDLDEWMSRVHPTDKRMSYSDIIRHVKGETLMYENEYRLRVGDGSYKWILTRGKVVEWNAEGRATLMLGVYSDITERKNTELISLRQQAALQALNEIAALPSEDVWQQLQDALALGARYLGVNKAYVRVVQRNQYKNKVHYDAQQEQHTTEQLDAEQFHPLAEIFCDHTLAVKDVVAEDNLATSAYANHSSFSFEKIETYIGVPLCIAEKIYGTLCFCSHQRRHHQYDELDRDFVKLLARWVCTVLERWQQDQEIKIIVQRFHKLNERLPGFLYEYQLRPDGSSFFPYASSGIKNIYNIHPEDVLESAAHIFSMIHPDDLDWVRESVEFSAQNLTPWIASVRVMNPKRGLIWTHIESIPERLEDGGVLWHGYASDITSLKETENQLQEINALRKAIFDAANMAIVSTDINGIIKVFNRGAESLLFYSAEELLENSTPVIWHLPEELEACVNSLSRELGRTITPDFNLFSLLAGSCEVDEREWTFVRKDGSHVPVIMTLNELRDTYGNVSGYLGMARDISELKRIDKMKGEFISTVSHELRTPLTAISGALGVLTSGMVGALPEQATRMLQIAHSNSMRLIYLVNDLLDMEKLVAGKMHFEVQEHSLNELIQHALQQNASYAQQYGVTYEEAEGNPEVKVLVDAQRLQQVLSNYLSNAAKFSPEGEVVKVRVQIFPEYVRVAVIDKGPGVPTEFRDRLFQKFSQADSSDTRKKGGTGLGLAICKEIIERLEGVVGMEPNAVEGSCFYFDLPYLKLPEVIGLDQHTREIKSERSILLVEDNAETAEIIMAVLAPSGYVIDWVSRADDAMKKLSQRPYQLLMLDLHLPDSNGTGVVQALRDTSGEPHGAHQMPIMIVSGNIDDARKTLSKNIHKHHIYWVQKPIENDHLIIMVERIVALELQAEKRNS